MRQLLVVQPRAYRYRREFYGGLRDALHAEGIRLSVVVGQSLGPRDDTYSEPYIHVVGDGLSELSGDRLRWRSPRRVREFAGAPDLLVVEQAVKNLDTYEWLLRRKSMGASIAMWGHGRSFSTPQGRALAGLKQFVTRRCDWFFAYTDEGAEHVVRHGFPRTRITVVNNTTDIASLQSQLADVTPLALREFRSKWGLQSATTALFLGGVDAAKDIPYLLEVACEVERALPGFVLLVGGTGDQIGLVQHLQARGGPVRALGRLDGADKAMAMASSRVIAIPTWIGLVAVDSLAAGVPIVTRWERAHSPEASYLTPGVDSVWLPHDTSPSAFAHAVVEVLQDDAYRHSLAQACLEHADRHAMSGMVERFAQGVVEWDEIRRFHL